MPTTRPHTMPMLLAEYRLAASTWPSHFGSVGFGFCQRRTTGTFPLVGVTVNPFSTSRSANSLNAPPPPLMAHLGGVEARSGWPRLRDRNVRRTDDADILRTMPSDQTNGRVLML